MFVWTITSGPGATASALYRNSAGLDLVRYASRGETYLTCKLLITKVLPDYYTGAAPGLSLLETALCLEQASCQALSLKARYEVVLGRPAEAIRDYRAALEGACHGEIRVTERLELGCLLAIANDPDGAVVEWQAARASKYFENYAEQLIAKREWPSAESAARIVTQIEPASPVGYYQLVKICMETGERDKQRDLLRLALARDDSVSGSRCLWQGRLYVLEGEKDRALDAFRCAYRLNPKIGSAHISVGEILLERGNYAEAFKECAEESKLAPDFYWADICQARALTGMGRLPEAVALLRRALARQPRNADLYFALGATLREAGDKLAAVDALVQATRLRGKVWYYHLELASLYEEMGRVDMAVMEYRAVLEGDPSNVEARASLRRLGRPVLPQAQGD